MPRIHILPEHLRNIIAAGEVIERPASVVKELIENSLDAGARDIKIEVLYGGKKLIRVSDDGGGMEREEALLSVERYATSKISNIEDLWHLKTLGFRGEALASIASVSKLTIETGTDVSRSATFIEIRGGEIKEIKEAPPLKGTIVTVKDLFFNTPARRKFLKANSTERAHIIETIIYEALADPMRGYKLFAEDREVLFLPAAYEPRERVLQVFGMEVFEYIMEFEYASDKMGLQAFISRPPEARTRRTSQYLFINKRPVKDYLVSKAIYDGLGEFLPKDKHPIFVIYLTLPFSMVDFNVHPTKREVMFSDNASVYEFVKMAIADAVAHGKGVYKRTAQLSGSIAEPKERGSKESQLSPLHAGESPAEALLGLTLFERVSAYEERPSFMPVGDAFVALSEDDGLLVMDIHACHERVLYERFLKGTIQIKRLLFPKQINLQPLYYRLLLEAQPLLRNLGIEIEDFGSSTVIVRTLPEPYKEESLRQVLEDMAVALMESGGSGSIPEILEKRKRDLAATLACHNSLKARETLTGPEIEALYKELLRTANPYHCPHGRPTIIKITIEELKKRFRRV